MTSTAIGTVDDRVRELFFRYDPTAPLQPEERVVSEDGGVRVTHFVISSTHGQRVPGLIWAPAEATGPLPAVILQHGSGGKKDDDYIRLPAIRWAQQGMACIAIDASGHGERAVGQPEPWGIWSRPWMRREHAVQMSHDLQRTVDYLQTRSDIDSGRLAYLGFSMGTINGVAFVALDERIKAAVFAIGGARLYDFRLMPDDPALRADMETVAALVDGVHFASRIAPRPVLMVNGRGDETVPPAAAQALFDALGEPRQIVWFDGGHTDLTGKEFKTFWTFLSEHV